MTVDYEDLTIAERIDLYYETLEAVIEARQMSPSCSYTFGEPNPALSDFGLTKEDLERHAAQFDDVTDDDISDIVPPPFDEEIPF